MGMVMGSKAHRKELPSIKSCIIFPAKFSIYAIDLRENFMSSFKRRTFLKNSILTGVGASVLNLDPLMANNPEEFIPSKNSASKKIIVGGAGLGGMCCAYELMKKGHEVVVLEASGRHGGHVFTVHDGLSDGLYGDFGMEHITKPGYDR